MLARFKAFGWLGALALVLALFVFKRSGLTGDGVEYLLMTHALLAHGSLEIRPDDVAAILNAPPALLGDGRLPREFLAALQAHLQQLKPEGSGGFFPALDGKFYAMHFWLYSLLALPFYALVKLLGLKPTLAFVLLNMSFALAVYGALRRTMGERARLGFALFLALGTTFYVGRTGPEVMTACCLLIALLASMRGRVGLATFLLGLGASQNPPLLLLLPAPLCYRALLLKWPRLAWDQRPLARLGWRDGLLAFGGALAALAPYLYFQLKYGIPSLVAHYASAPELIGLDRMQSLLLDLNQGMAVGVPGLLAGLALAACLLPAARRARWLALAALLACATLVMLVPTLAAGNWNSDYAVMVRYNYWLAMPLLALLLLGVRELPEARARALAALVLGLQLAVIASAGVMGDNRLHTEHTKLAKWVLDHHPTRYNPQPEIFYERGTRVDGGLVSLDQVYLHQHDGKPRKLLRHWSNGEASAGLCPQGQTLHGSDPRTVESGWQYLHAPFTCLPADAAGGAMWRIGAAHDARVLAGGWYATEPNGVWSQGHDSLLTLTVPPGRQALRLRLLGHYYLGQNSSAVTVNGQPLGELRLDREAIELPAALRGATQLSVRLQHPKANSPLSQKQGQDGRLLGFFLRAGALETDHRP